VAGLFCSSAQKLLHVEHKRVYLFIEGAAIQLQG
jgi:hypothetical protein